MDTVLKFVSGLALVCWLAGCAEPPPQGPERAGQPLDPLRTAGQLASIRSAVLLGDQQGVQDGLMAMHEDFRKAIRLADPARRVDREAAREALRGLDGVASAVWLDHENLFVLVDLNALRTQQMIDAICMRLEPLGDTLGVVVNLQSTAARTGEEQATLSRNCQLAGDERALLQRARQVDVVSAEHREQQKRAQAWADARGDRSREAQESLEILMESTPELPRDPWRQ
jgi:hypothetical protein